MNFCTLRPPNDRFLSDDIVGGVVERRSSGRYFRPDNYQHSAVRANNNEWRQSSQPRVQPQAPEYTRARQVQNSTNNTLTRPGAIIPERDAIAVLGLLSLTGEKRKRESESPKNSYPSNKSRYTEACTPQHETDTESLNSDKQENYHREEENYRRERQKKEYDRMTSLEKETRQLREEIMSFEQQRRAISAALPAQQNGWDVALEYFQQFRYGLQSRGCSNAIRPTNAQIDLLRTAMVPDVVFNSGQGVEAMMRSWKCLSMWFQDVELEIEGIDRGAAGSLVAIARTSVTITERTLRNVFPHLCSSSSNRRLADRLLGQRIVMRGLTRFEWDGLSGRFTSVMAHSDLLTPMLRLLGSVEDASLVFDRSIISPDFQWRSSR
ncbi:hypothetical protein PHYSODRAFT_505437 [Phytophthora sojae]|uniref:Uncharacterized protein n=1 Tax=Phytophthora sojae (strain P6497) TaxID=1094619 RepID=G4ZPL5_PHYSP|nr:hypothetical protein PHYSODRAFT_505437 [Phytophthora sojae]EGZ16327.1 hypothetical protein PHYSODRAFT_505437 [Phytophthora sojae]|eukprot:XP_009530076.1 hypothetical protein PHYSODRAFT_505437 [Phytophthora sojae]